MLPGLKIRIASCFPLLPLWVRLPGVVSWAATSAGIGLASFFTFDTCSGIMRSPAARIAALPVLLLLAACGILIRRAPIRFLLFSLAALLLVIVHRAREVEVFDAFRTAADERQPLVIAGKVASAPLPWNENYRFLLTIDSLPGIASGVLAGLTVECVCPVNPERYRSVRVEGSFSQPEIRRNPFEYDRFRGKMAQGIWGTITAASCRVMQTDPSLPERLSTAARGATLDALGRIGDYDDRAVLQASLLGETGYLSPHVNDLFRRSGTYHLIAISGLNVAMLTGALFFLLRRLRLGRTAATAICIAAVWAYLPFVGMIPSLFRATIMATVVLAALLFERKQYPLQALGIAGTLWLALSPDSLFDPGYQLSFATTGALIVFMPIMNRFIPKPRWKPLEKLSWFFFGSLYVSIVSFLASAPVLLYHFGTVSWFGIAANLVAVAAMTASLWALLAGIFVQAVAPIAAIVPLWLAERFMDLVFLSATGAMILPWSRIPAAVPPMELTVLAALLAIGAAAIRPALLGRFLLGSAAIAALVVPLDLRLLHAHGQIEVVRFVAPRSTLLGIRWPDGHVWVVSPKATPGLAQLLAVRVAPWVRHACRNRIDALVVPENSREMVEEAVAMLPLSAPIRVMGFPFRPGRDPEARARSLPTPTLPPGCRCAVAGAWPNLTVRVAAPDFDTTIPLPAAGFESGFSPEFEDRELRSAAVFRPAAPGIDVGTVVAADHPLR